MKPMLGETSISDLLALLSKHQVTTFKCAEFELARDNVIEYSQGLKQPLTEQEAALLKDPLLNPMTEEQVLFWSSGGSEFTDTKGNEVPVPLTGEELQVGVPNE